MTLPIHDPNDPLYGMKIIDADSHLTEWPELWTERVPASYRDKVPHLGKDTDGRAIWLFNGDDLLIKGGAASVIRPDGTKRKMEEIDISEGIDFDQVHPASWDGKERCALLDQQGIWAQIIYPNVAGFGANLLLKLEDKELALNIVSIYNDAMAEYQKASGGRLRPQALVPFWDIKASVKEVERAADMGLCGIAMCSEPHLAGFPDLLQPDWEPMWELCSERNLPINFHVGASEAGLQAFFNAPWPSQDQKRGVVVSSAMVELDMARVIANLICSRLLDKFPKTKWVSVESGIGWLPYLLERLEYQLADLNSEGDKADISSPRENWMRQVYGCFWFEQSGPLRLLDLVGFDNVLFETDFPHATCLYPNPVERALEVLKPWGPEVIRKVMSENSAKLYNVPI